MTPWPTWLRLGLLLPLVGVNAFVLRRVLVQFAPFPGLFLTAALIAFLLDLPCRWLVGWMSARPIPVRALLRGPSAYQFCRRTEGGIASSPTSVEDF